MSDPLPAPGTGTPPRHRSSTPCHDLRSLRTRLLSVLDDVDALAEALRDPADAPELSDHEAAVSWQGKPYAVVGSATHLGTDLVSIHIKPRGNARD